MRKKILAFVFFGILSIILAGCTPGVTIGFNPEEVTIDLGTIDEDLPKEISFNIRFMGMGTLELKSLDFEMGIQDREGVLEGEDSLEFLGEIFNDLFSYLDDENPYRENGGYFFRQDLNITIPVLPFFGVEDEAEQLPGKITLEKEAFEALEGKLISDSELEIVLRARVMGPVREKASANFLVTIIDSTN